ncbi:unnamed protein product [Caenorhabditis auriculariae]|uniref:Protein FAM184A/B N-terminal domain-containing protein n=1 Tax=Caenorhabditis auriculariae TaxID=2777116 RepID=A0A8S1H5I2_9PELO|nr:unnamed protein product [Caenorhabditis auriculariae]
MSERFRERLGLLSEELNDPTRSVSPTGSRSPRRMSRSPRPHTSHEPAIGITHPVVRDSRPEIAAWPAPTVENSLRNDPPMRGLSGNVRTLTVGPAPMSPSPISPISQHSPASSKHEFENTSTLLTALKVAAASSNAGFQPIGRETELKRKIQTLEETVAEYERQKYNVMGTFSEYRERVAERERKLEAEYSSKIIALSEEVLGAKKDFEARMKSFQALQDKFEREKEQALEKLRKEHQKEIQLLEQRFSDTQLLNLEQKYILEIQRLEEERKSLRTEKERLGETFEMKLRRAQSLYETELTAAKMLYTRELEALRDHEEALKEELLARQDEFHDRLQELQLQSKKGREELVCCKNEVTALEKKLQNKEKEVQAITKELDVVKTETTDNLRRLSVVTAEFTEYKQKYQQQEEELKRKARLLSVVEAAKDKLESVISDLQVEVKALKNKVEFLEKERENLQSQSESQAHLQNSQVDALEAVLDSVTKEKESTKEHYEGLLIRERQQAEAREHAMKKEFSSKLNELEEQYTSLKEELEESARLDKDELRESTQYEIQVLKSEKEILEEEVKTLSEKMSSSSEDPDEVTAQLAKIVEDTTSLTKALDEYRKRIDSKDEEIGQLRRRIDEEAASNDERRREDFEKAQENLHYKEEQYNQDIKSVKAELDQYRGFYENEKRTSKERSKKIKELEGQNFALHAELGHVQKAVEAMGEECKITEELRASIEKKNHTISTLEEKVQNLTEELSSVEISYKEETDSSSKVEDLEKTIRDLESEDISKSNQIENLHAKVSDMLNQMDTIKEELQKKNDEIESISSKNDNILKDTEQQQAQTEKTLADLKNEHAQKIEELEKTINLEKLDAEKKDEEIGCLKAALKSKDSEIETMKEELEHMTQQLNEETTVVLLDQTIENRVKEKEEELEKITEELQSKNRRVESLQVEISEEQKIHRAELKKRDELIEQLTAAQEQRLYVDEQMPQTSKSEQSPDLTRERHLKDRIDELEGALERKNDLIQQLQGRLCDESASDNFSKKRSSITSHGVFQSFVSQMKDKRDEAHERSKKKEAEKKAEKEKEKAAKEAAKEIAREKSPARSKSPSLLTRLRDRSPAKSKSPNLETTPSTSSRNLLSPSDAEKRLERSSPSRPLFSRSKRESTSEKRPAWKF